MKTSPETAATAQGITDADHTGDGPPAARPDRRGTVPAVPASSAPPPSTPPPSVPPPSVVRPSHAATLFSAGTPCVPARCSPPPGRAWLLPGGPGCAGYARAVLAEALAALGTPRSAIGDAQLMVSELATNAHQHAHEHGPHELWLYAQATGPPGGTYAEAGAEAGAEGGLDSGAGTGLDDGFEARCAVFDRHAGARLPGYSWTSGDYGRGLSIVRELSEGRWGMLRTLSRCLPRARGKAVWFAVPAAVRLTADLVHPPYGAAVPVLPPGPPAG